MRGWAKLHCVKLLVASPYIDFDANNCVGYTSRGELSISTVHIASVMLISHVYCLPSHSLSLYYSLALGSFLGERPSCDSLSVAYKVVEALISPNLYPQKTKGKRGHIKIQGNSGNSNK